MVERNGSTSKACSFSQFFPADPGLCPSHSIYGYLGVTAVLRQGFNNGPVFLDGKLLQFHVKDFLHHSGLSYADASNRIL